MNVVNRTSIIAPGFKQGEQCRKIFGGQFFFYFESCFFYCYYD